jgi:hypothetical protein
MRVAMISVPKFLPQRLTITPNARATLSRQEIDLALARHLSGDWGDLNSAEWAHNDASLCVGLGLLSLYRAKDGEKFFVITDGNRSETTVLLASDYD